MRRLILVSFIAVLVQGCAQGMAEFALYAEAYREQRTVGEDVLGRLGKAERTLFRRIEAGQDDAFAEFVPENAAYYLDVGDPPITASFRASIAAIDSYNAALLALADGEGVEAYLAASQALAGNINAAAAALGVAETASAAVAGAPALLGPVGAALALAQPLADLALTAASRQEFRVRLIAVKPAMEDFIESLRAASPAMFAVMRRAAERTATLAEGGGFVIDDPEALQRDRALLAGWVLLLDRSKAALAAAAAAVTTPGSAAGRAALIDASVGFKALTATIKATQ